jgi:hypothetical protein
MSSPLAGSEDEVSICSTSSESNDTSDSGDSSDEHCDSGEEASLTIIAMSAATTLILPVSVFEMMAWIFHGPRPTLSRTMPLDAPKLQRVQN